MLQTRSLILAVLSGVAIIASIGGCNKEAPVILADVDGHSFTFLIWKKAQPKHFLRNGSVSTITEAKA
jgi:hypothetical protein